jgi:hypothetical protein
VSNVDSSRRSETDPTISYSRRSGDYVYDINCYKTTMPAKGDRFVAFAVNMVRIESGQWVPVIPGLPGEYGETRAKAIAAMKTAVDAWVKTRPD